MSMKTNIIISASQQFNNKCIMGDTEDKHCQVIANKVADMLKAYDCNICLIPALSGTETERLIKVVNISNDFVKANPAGMSYHLDLHSDAGYNGSGACGFYVSEGGKAFMLKVWKEVSNLTPWGDGEVTRRDNLHVLNATDAIAGLLEISFHDKLDEARWMHESSTVISKTITRGIVIATGIREIPKVEVSDANEAIKVLVAKGIVNSPEYWLKAVDVTKNLDTLIINTVKALNEHN